MSESGRCVASVVLMSITSVIFLVSTSLFAIPEQKPQFKFQHVGLEKELGVISSIIQDQQGIIWLLGDGLEKFDGINSTSFIRTERANSLLENDIYSLFLDSKGIIWIGYREAGISRFDPKTEQFLHFPADNILKEKAPKHEKEHYANIINQSETQALTKGLVSGFYEDKLGNIWVASAGGVYRLSAQDQLSYQLTRVSHTQSDDKFVFSVQVDAKQNVWIGTPLGVFYSEQGASSPINRIDFKPFKLMQNSATPSVVRIKSIQGNKLWLSTITDGLFEIDLSTMTATPLFEKQVNWSVTITYNIAQANNGDIWLATSNGLGFVDSENQQLVFYQFDASNTHSIKDNDVFYTFIDHQGEIWISTEGGIQKLNTETAFFKTMPVSQHFSGQLKEKDIATVYVDSKSTLWIGGANTGLYQQKYQTSPSKLDSLIHLQQDSSSIFNLPTPDVRSFFEDSKGRYWLGTRYNGVYKIYNKQGEQAYSRMHYPKLIKANVESSNWNDVLFEDANNNIWVANISGLFVYSEQHDKFIKLTLPSLSSTKNEPARITVLHQLKQGVLVGNLEGEIFYAVNNTMTFKPVKVINQSGGEVKLGNISAIVSTADTLWITSSQGLFKGDLIGKRKGELIENGTKSEQLALVVDVIEITDDNKGRIYNLFPDQQDPNLFWLNHRFGVSTFNSETQSFYHFNQLIGYSVKGFSAGCGFQSKQGSIYLCGNDGVLSFDPHMNKALNAPAPNVIFTQLYINNQVVDVNTSNSVLDFPINYSSSVTLNDKQNNFAFDFAALDYTDPLKNQYAYNLEGFDQEWISTTSKRRHANYSNIPAGEYKFKIKASNHQGVWNEQGAHIQLIILPAWYMTWWALSIWGLLLLCLIYCITIMRTKQLKQRSLELENAVNERTTELKQAQKTIAQQEKMSSLGTLSAGIAHEINNPTNFVYGSCQNMEADLERALEFFIELADDADEEIIQAFEEQFKPLHGHVDIISDGAKRIKKIVDGMSVFARSDKEEMENTSIQQCIETTVGLVKTEYKDVTEFNLVFNASPNVLCYPSKINQVLMNLLVNASQAIKGNTKGGSEDYFGNITVTTSVENDVCQIAIQDNGKGISLEDIEKIFEPFFTTKTVGEGTGLGLALSYEIVQQHGGGLTVESEVGVGAKFILTLPV